MSPSGAASQDDASSSVSKSSYNKDHKTRYFNSNLIQNKCVIWEQLVGPPLVGKKILLESKCYLWTEQNTFKAYNAVIEGMHIFCYSTGTN